MRVYNDSDLRKNLSAVLNQAKCDGAVRITRQNGDTFVIQPEKNRQSPLDVKGIDLKVSSEDIVSMVREARAAQGTGKN